MNFIWHREQHARNLAVHGLDFHDVKHVFDGPTMTYETAPGPDRRPCFATIGVLNGRPVTVTHCPEPGCTRIVEFRAASSRATRSASRPVSAPVPSSDHSRPRPVAVP